jgi:hypothetical protein
MDDKTLRRRLIRLAYERPELRDEILPLVTSQPREASRLHTPLYQEVLPAVLDHVLDAETVAKEVERISKTYAMIENLSHRQRWTEVKRHLGRISEMLKVVSSDMSRLADAAAHYEKWISQEGA